ncbi:MAG: hypothetical protein II331_01365 [Lachnospiraceae bacterium]|nr:hypothetical protein [Lachnospiraceae bacterium]
MEDKEQFLSSIQDLIQIAKTQDNQLHIDEIKSYFHDMLEESKLQFVYSYLTGQQIQVVGYDSQPTESSIEEIEVNPQEVKVLNQQEEDSLIQFYLSELANIPDYSKEEQKQALLQYADHKKDKNQLVEMFLKDIVKMAQKHENQGVLVGDLIQEGNIAFLTILEENLSQACDNIDWLFCKLEEAMKATLDSQKMQNYIGQTLAKKANDLDVIAQRLAKELEREATKEELAKAMGVSEEEIEEIMKISLDAISVD